MIARQVFFEGHVQGVGFRYTVKNIAKGYDVRGWVRNLADGRVEMQAAGEAGELEAFLLGIQESELRGHIRKTEAAAIQMPAGMRGFEIK